MSGWPWKAEQVTHAHAHVAPDHPRSAAALVFGLVSLLGALFILPAAFGPLACYLGVTSRRAIELEPHRWGGHGQATAGMVLGIIASAILALLAVFSLLTAALLAIAVRIDTGYR